jgi:hypothetical protein
VQLAAPQVQSFVALPLLGADANQLAARARLKQGKSACLTIFPALHLPLPSIPMTQLRTVASVRFGLSDQTR